MKRVLLSALVVVSMSGCAMIRAVASGNPNAIASAAGDLALKTKRVNDNTTRDCEPLKAAKVIYSEERAIGGAIAIALTQKYKANYFLDGMAEKDPAAAKTLADAGKIKLASSDKNALSGYVALVGKNLAAQSTRPDINWSFGVMESPTVNAFSAPGGYVVVTTGLLGIVENEAQLAGVLAHEIGHVNGKHAINAYMGAKHALCVLAMTAKYGKDEFGNEAPSPIDRAIAEGSRFVDPILKALSGKGEFALDSDDFGADFVAKLTDLFMEAYSTGAAQPDEYDADKTALELVLSAGYDSTQYEALLAKLPTLPFSSHPPGDKRVEALKALKTGEGEFSMWANGKSKGEAPPASFKAVPKPQG
jgi:beta-barrel assembly-enhancing protease